MWNPFRNAALARFLGQTATGSRRAPRPRSRSLHAGVEPLEQRPLLSSGQGVVHAMLASVPVWTGDWNIGGGLQSASGGQLEFISTRHDNFVQLNGQLAIKNNGNLTFYVFTPTVSNNFVPNLRGNVEFVDPATLQHRTVGTFNLVLQPNASKDPAQDSFVGTYTVNGVSHSLNATYAGCPNGSAGIFNAGCEGVRDEPNRGGGGGGGGQIVPGQVKITISPSRPHAHQTLHVQITDRKAPPGSLVSYDVKGSDGYHQQGTIRVGSGFTIPGAARGVTDIIVVQVIGRPDHAKLRVKFSK